MHSHGPIALEQVAQLHPALALVLQISTGVRFCILQVLYPGARQRVEDVATGQETLCDAAFIVPAFMVKGRRFVTQDRTRC